MNISYNWLKELIDIELSPEETATALTRVGLAVEGIHAHKDDYVLDVDLTSNRPDCLSHLGVARELSVITGSPLRSERRSDNRVPDAPFPSILAPDIVSIEATDLCSRFTARIFRNVTIGPSPQWLVDRLEAIGERSINNVADITNYVMHELGQPMHAFDLDKLTENRIVVRRARPGETIKTLDEVERKLDESMLAICDSEKPVAVAGVMGGLDSGITDATMNVLLEVAYFDRSSIRQTSRKLDLVTEASYRFERGVDIENLKRASDRAAELIGELAGGDADSIVDVYPTATPAALISAKQISASVERLTGLSVSQDDALRILTALGFSHDGANGDDALVVPSWRHDIAIEEDLVEEIARHTGYENIEAKLPPAFGSGEYQPTELHERRLRLALADQGFDEAISYSFIDRRHDTVFQSFGAPSERPAAERYVTLKDSVIEGAVRMRHTLLPGLLSAVRGNLNQQRRDLKLFELGKAFSAGPAGELPDEHELFALVITGSETSEQRRKPIRDLDFYDAKGAVELALDAVGAATVAFQPDDDVSHLQRGQAASIAIDGRKIGYLGRLNEEISADYKFKQPVYVAEIDIQAVLEAPPAAPAYTALSKYPSIVRDVSFTVTRDLSFEDLRRAAESSKSNLCREISFVDVYEGKGMAAGERSLTIRFSYRSDERTLTEGDIEELHSQMVAGLEEGFSIRQRM